MNTQEKAIENTKLEPGHKTCRRWIFSHLQTLRFYAAPKINGVRFY
jgi:hypothetical protein